MILNKIKDNELGTSHSLSPGGGGGLGGRGGGVLYGGKHFPGGGRISLEEHIFQGGMERLTVILDRALWGKGTLGK